MLHSQSGKKYGVAPEFPGITGISISMRKWERHSNEQAMFVHPVHFLHMTENFSPGILRTQIVKRI
jgi:hypothetical protein